MCLILFACRVHPRFPLVFAGNRDESYVRPTAPAAFWLEARQVFGGRDLEHGGTWLGVSLAGRFAAVTNFRERPAAPAAPRSRGALAADFLRGNTAPLPYLAAVARTGGDFRPFSLLVGDCSGMAYYSNRGGDASPVTPGVHGLSNGLLDAPWPKVSRGKAALETLLGADERLLAAELFRILADRTPAPDEALPATGIGLERERALSPLFIAGEQYGTRASTVVLVREDGAVLFLERAFGPGGVQLGEVEQRLVLDAPAFGCSAAPLPGR